MKRVVITAVVSLVILGVAFWGYQTYLAPVPTPTPVSGVSTEPIEQIVSAEGVVVPARSVNLAFKTMGRVIAIAVEEGETVKQGTVLARLDDALWQKQIAQAQAQIEIAEKQYAAAQAQVQVAEKQLAQVKAGGTPEQIAAAQAAVEAALAAYAQVARGPTADELAALKAQLDNAKAALLQAQSAYDRAGGASNPFIGQLPEALQLEQATNNYNAALAAYNEALAHPTAAELAAAQAQIEQAREALARLTPTQEQIDVAQAQLDSARRAVEAAQAQVAAARAALETIRAQADDYRLVAPFDGTVATKNIELGQIVQPGVPVFVFGDLTTLQIETTDLAEVDAPRVKPGMPARITTDNFPDKTYRGTVKEIAPLATDFRGDKVFKVTITLEAEAQQDLKWGMTTNVEIVVSAN